MASNDDHMVQRTATIQREIEAQNRKYCDRGVTWRYYKEPVREGTYFERIQIIFDDTIMQNNQNFHLNTADETTALLNV